MANSLKSKLNSVLYGSLFALMCAGVTAIASLFIYPIAGDKTILVAGVFNGAALALAAILGGWTASTGFAIAFTAISFGRLLPTSYETLVMLLEVSTLLLAELATILAITLFTHVILPRMMPTHESR